MKAVSVKELKEELNNRSPKELRELSLRLAKFKKENKELLTYILFESNDEVSFVEGIKREIDQQFDEINIKTNYYIKKSLRKILRGIRKYARYSHNKQTEVDLLIYFCTKLKQFTPPVQKNTRLLNIYNSQIDTIIKKITVLHEDLQFDYFRDLEDLNNLPSGN